MMILDQGTVTVAVSVDGSGDSTTIQGGLDLLKENNCKRLLVRSGVYSEEVKASMPLYDFIDIVCEPGAILDGQNKLACGLALSGSWRVYGLEAKNYTLYGLQSNTFSIVEWYECAAYGCGEAALNAQILSRLIVYGGLYSNSKYGIRIYSCSVGSLRVNPDTGKIVRLKDNNLAGMIIRESSNVRGDKFLADGNRTGVVIMGNSRAHIKEATFANADIGVKGERGSSFFDDNNIYRATVKKPYVLETYSVRYL